MTINELETPCVVIDLDRVEANLHRLQSYLDSHSIANRPHIKTHKIPALARQQMAGGAVGICCQKLGEAEVMVEAGISDIFIPYNLLGPKKIERLTRLLERAKIRVAADSATVVEGLGKVIGPSGLELDVVVEFDTGAERCGVQNPSEAEELALLIHKLPGLRFAGLMTYPLGPSTDDFVKECRRRLAPAGLNIEVVSSGGTHCMNQVHLHPEVTEHRAGMYIYGDRNMVVRGAMELEDCALRVLSTVVSRPTRERGILDAGSKSLSSDLVGLEGHGLILEYPEARIRALSEEHGHVDFGPSVRRPEIGERVSVLPNHCCPVSNLFDQVYGIRKNEVEQVFKVEARGKVV